MKIHNYKKFIVESGHYPTPIKQIYYIIEQYCYEKLEAYLDRKGKFANYSDIEHFTWKEIEERIIDDEMFKKFPVEEMYIKFSIVLDKYSITKQSYTSSYYTYKTDMVKSKLIQSKSKLVKKAINLVIDIGLIINPNAKSIKPEIFEDYISSNLHHELTHAYQEYQQKQNKVNFTNVWDTMNQMAPVMWETIRLSQPLIDLFWLIYKTSYPELNADIATATQKWDNIMDDILDTLQLFDPEEYYKMVQRDLIDAEYDVDEITKNFGKNFIKLYRAACKEERVKPNPKVLKLENKDMKYVFEYWNKIFQKRFEYIKKKLDLQEIQE